MPFTISPGVVTKEIDLTTVVPEISMTEGAIAGPFKWGPAVDRRHQVSARCLHGSCW